MLVVINAFTKYVWSVPVKNKTGKEVTRVTKQILSKNESTPKNLKTDLGKEFYNSGFKQLMETSDINQYSTFSNVKASIAERVIRTLK